MTKGRVQRVLLRVAVALLALRVPDAVARVSMRIRGDANMILASAGGTQVHAADVEVNGQPATLRVFGFEEGSEAVGSTLMTRFGLDAAAMREGAMLKLPARYGAAWLFVLPGMTGDVASAIFIEARGAVTASPPWLFPQLPKPAGFTLTFSALDKETGVALCSGRSSMPVEASMAMLRRMLVADGWVAATPASERVTAVFFVKGEDVALVSASPLETGSGLLLMASRR